MPGWCGAAVAAGDFLGADANATRANATSDAIPLANASADGADGEGGAGGGGGGEAVEAVVASFLREQMTAAQPENALLIACYVPLFLVAGAANAITVAAVARFRYMRSATNYFLVSLSAADLLVTLICMPTAVAHAATRLWLSGAALCKLSPYLQGVSVSASVFTLAAMSVDRCLAVRQPLAARRAASRRNALFVIALVWVAAAALCLPVLWVRALEVVPLSPARSVAFCVELWRHPCERAAYDAASVALLYLLPGGAVVLSYTLTGRRLCAAQPPSDAAGAGARQGRSLVRERRRAARLLALLALLFAACWLPYHALTLVMDFRDATPLLTLLRYSLLLGHANSAVNPLVYCFMTRAFRHSARQLLALRGKGGRGSGGGRGLQRRKARRQPPAPASAPATALAAAPGPLLR